MPVDTSFYPTAQARPNMLETFGQYQGIKNAQVQNQLMQQEQVTNDRRLRGQAALGRAIKSATDETGQVNQNLLVKNIANDPDASWMALQVQGEARGANPLTDYIGKNTNGEPTPMQAPESTVRGIGNPGQRVKPGPSQGDIDALHKHNRAMIDTLQPLADDPNLDEGKVTNAVVDLVAHPDAKFNATDGGVILSQLPHGPSGAAATHEQLQPLVQQHLQQQKHHEAVLSQVHPSSEQLAARQAQQPPQEDQPQEAAPPAPAASDAGSPGSATGLPAGFEKSQTNAIDQYNTVQQNAGQSQRILAPLRGMRQIIDAGLKTGNTKAWQNEFRTAAVANGLIPASGDFASAFQRFQKLAADNVAQQGGATDQARANIAHANPNDEMLPQTLKAIIPYAMATPTRSLMEQAAYNAAKVNGRDPEKFAKIKQTFDQAADQRAIELLLLDPDDQRTFLKAMPRLQRDKVMESARALHKIHATDALKTR